VRIDSGVYPGWTVPIDYDPLLAKLVVWGLDRETAIRRMSRAIDEYAVSGIETNLAFFAQLLRDEEFTHGRLHTGFIEGFLKRRPGDPHAMEAAWKEIAARVAAVHAASHEPPPAPAGQQPSSRWLSDGRSRMLR
jgi:acetyl-CoA carboxylase biotin carboxylase subunit